MTFLDQKPGIPVFDIEAIGWVNPIAVGFFDGYEYKEFIRESEEDNVIRRFLECLETSYQGIRLYAHCASKYDNKFILAELCKMGKKVTPEAGLIRLKWEDTKIFFEDSYPLVPMSLKNMNKMFKVEEKEEWSHKETVKPWEMGEHLTTFREYLRIDCLSLSHSLEKLCEELGRNFGITPSISLATTSVKAFNKCFYDLDNIHSNEEFEDFIRGAVYGGRNEVYKRYGENINLYDIRSMYVSCYDTPVPIGKMFWTKKNIDKGTIAEATVQVPKDWYIGPLPYRREGRLIFPVGEITSVWDIKELQNAVRLGCDLIIRRQMIADEEPVLAEFGKYVLSLRSQGKQEFWKMFGLSLSGKFGQGRWRDTVKHIEDIKDDRTDWTPLDKDELYFIKKEYSSGRLPYIKPAVAMRVRAEARIRHLRSLLQAKELGDIFYCDTDSVYTTSKIETKGQPGELTLFGKASRGYFIRQKLYALVQNGRLKQTSAGYSDLKLSEDDFRKILEGEEVRVVEENLPNFKEVLKAGEVELLTHVRKIKKDQGSSRVSEGMDTRPICINP